MASNRVRKFRTLDEVQTFLNGGIWSGNTVNQVQGSPSNHGPGITGLVGLTLIFVGPGPTGTVTFVASSGSNPDPNTLLFKDIKAQIEAVMMTCKVTTYEGFLTIMEATPALGVTVSHTGTANTLLGFDTANNTVGKYYLPAAAASPPVPPYWVWVNSLGGDNMMSVFTVE
jgi:hypothetical protein